MMKVMTAAGAWPADGPADPGGVGRGRLAPHADVLAALITFIAGGLGVAHLWLSWSSSVLGLHTESGITGWQTFRVSQAQAGAGTARQFEIAAYAAVGVALVGGALVLLSIGMLAPINHRPLGLVGLMLSLASFGAALWWLFKASDLLGESFTRVFVNAGPGWYLFLVSGFVGIIGSSRALRKR